MAGFFVSATRTYMPRSLNPTDEQHAIVDAISSSDDLKIKAYAGAGKTSTLGLIATQLHKKRGSYLAFNKEIADHARRSFPPNVTARTFHALAYASVKSGLTARVNFPAEPPHELAARYNLNPVQVPTVTGKTVEVTQFELGRMVFDGLGRFCRSAQDVPESLHIPVDEKIDENAARWLRETLLPYVETLWNESISPNWGYAIAPDVYLKVWAQAQPRIDVDFILFDEAQDSDGVMLATLALQHHAQVIYVGDPYQQIYEWRGAINAMDQIRAPERSLTESFRFGPTIAALASRLLSMLGEQTPVRGQEKIGSILVEDPTVSPPVDAILCRKNVTAIWQLAAGVVAGHKAAIRMSPMEIVAFAEGAESLLAGRRAYKPLAFSLFESWKDVQSFAATPFGRDLQPIVRIVDELGTGFLRDLARRVTPESEADYVISTVHRAKGLQWKRVRITNDFRFKTEGGSFTLDEDEMRLLYVAVTRAQHVLDLSELRDDLLRLFKTKRYGF